MISLEPATRQEIEAFGGSVKKSQRSIIVKEDGKPIAIFGLYRDIARMVLFMEVSPEIDRTKYKRAFVMGIRKLKEMMRDYTAPIQALADPDICKATNLLEHIGFKHITEGVYEWRHMQFQ